MKLLYITSLLVFFLVGACSSSAPPKDSMVNTGCCNLADDLEKFRKTIHSHNKQLHGAYQVALDKYPDIEVQIDLNIKILNNGVVEHVEIINSSLKNLELESKLKNIIKNIKFPPLEKNRDVKYALKFYPN